MIFFLLFQSYNPYELLAQLPENYRQESNCGQALVDDSSYAGISYDDVPLREQESYAEAPRAEIIRRPDVVAEEFNFRSARPCAQSYVEEAAPVQVVRRPTYAQEAVNYQPIRESYSNYAAPIEVSAPLRESFTNYAAPLEVSAQVEAPAPIEVVTAPTQTRVVNLPAPIAPATRVLSNSCRCRKTVVKSQEYQREIRIPIITKYIQKKYVPVVEKIRYNAHGLTGPEPSSTSEVSAASCERESRVPRRCGGRC